MYPYPHVDDLIPLMADGTLLPYLDIPLQHASPKILKAMKRPGSIDRTLERIKQWREICPDLNCAPPLLLVSLAKRKKISNYYSIS
ncbi:unnamed protein product [Haemophilus influenzae 10810]|nr:unnamed protein product [Haemophilus influenzae 10810]